MQLRLNNSQKRHRRFSHKKQVNVYLSYIRQWVIWLFYFYIGLRDRFYFETEVVCWAVHDRERCSACPVAALVCTAEEESRGGTRWVPQTGQLALHFVIEASTRSTPCTSVSASSCCWERPAVGVFVIITRALSHDKSHMSVHKQERE